MESVIPIIAGKDNALGRTIGGIPFRNLDPLTDGTIVPGNPNVYYGARPEQLDRRVRQELGGVIIPSTQDNLPIAPNFFLAVKGPNGTPSVALQQASYDGTLGTRGMDGLRGYAATQPGDKDIACTISSIYHGGQLKIFSCHSGKTTDQDSHPQYYMHQLRSFAMTDSSEVFREGARAYRNARDWAQEQRNSAIDNANAVVSVLLNRNADTGVSLTSTEVDDGTDRPGLIEEVSSPDSVQYTTPPSGEYTSITTFEASSFGITTNETTSSFDTNKRTRQQVQGSSPLQQQKRHRPDRLDDSPSPGPSTMTASVTTGLSFQLEDQGLEQKTKEDPVGQLDMPARR